MPENSVSFSEFPVYSREEWLQKIEKDLKGRSLAELDWQLETDWQLSPFWHDPQAGEAPILRGRTHNNWQVGAIVAASEATAANTQALEELAGGVNAPLFMIPTAGTAALEHRLAGIEARFVSLHFTAAERGESVFNALQQWAKTQNLEPAELRGSLASPVTPTVTRTALTHWPHFRTIAVDGRPFLQPDRSPIEELAQTLRTAVERLQQLESAGFSTAEANAQLFFRVTIGRRYFLDIAKLRALRILWANVLAAYQLPEAGLPPVHAFVQLDAAASMEDNMIRSGTQAMAAAIGGAEVIFVPPASQQPSKRSFAQRIARNVQHLLQLESKLDQVLDPAAGSYFLEGLTDELCERAWTRFVAMAPKYVP